MVKSKAIQILKTFTAEEFRAFGKFINSPFHNNNKNITKLYAHLKQYFPAFDNKKFNKDSIHKKLFPSKAYRDDKIRELMSDLLKLEQNFLSYTNYLNSAKTDLHLLDELNNRKLDNLFNVVINSVMASLEKKSKLDEKVYKYSLDISEIKINYLQTRGKFELEFDDLIIYKENLVSYFLIRLFKTIQDLIQIEGTRSSETNMNLANEFMKSIDFERLFGYLRDKENKSYKILEMYYNMMMVYTKTEPVYFFRLKKLFTESSDILTHDENYDLLVSLANCSQYLILNGKAGFYEEFFEIYKIMISKKIFSESTSPYLSSANFRNIVGAGIQQKEFEWTETFIEENKDKLEPVQKENLINYSRALICYNKKEYDLALSCLSKVKYLNFFLKLDVRTLMLRIYYDLDAYEEFLSLSDTFSQMIKKSNLIKDIGKMNLFNYLRYSSELFKAKLDKNKELILKIKEQVRNNNQISLKTWIIEKINEQQKKL